MTIEMNSLTSYIKTTCQRESVESSSSRAGSESKEGRDG